MKKILLMLLFLVILIASFTYYKNNDTKRVIADVFKGGGAAPKVLKYRISLFGIIPVGEATFGPEEIGEYKGQRYYYYSASAESLRLFSRFFSANATVESYIDMKDLCPVFFRQKLSLSGKEDEITEATYDQKNNIMTREGVRRQILPNTQDPLSTMFNIMRTDFNNTSTVNLYINSHKTNYLLNGQAVQKERSVNGRNYDIVIIKARVKRATDNPYHQSDVTMVLLKGKQNIPILIRVFSGGFLMNIRLIEAK